MADLDIKKITLSDSSSGLWVHCVGRNAKSIEEIAEILEEDKDKSEER